MSHRYPIEALLRPPVELWSALVAGLAAVVAALAPWALTMTPDVACAAAGVLDLLVAWRLRQAWGVIRISANLTANGARAFWGRRLPAGKKRRGRQGKWNPDEIRNAPRSRIGPLCAAFQSWRREASS